MRQWMTGVCGIGLLAALAGCQPELAQVQEGQREAQWHQAIKESYGGFRPPRMASPAVKDNMSPRVAEEEEREAADAAEAAPAQEDPVIVEEVETVVVETEAPETAAAEEKKDAESAPEAEAVAVPEETAAAGECEEYEVKAGDTLSHIARKFYGKASLADVILKANSATVSDPKRLKPGMKLQIPKL